MSMDPEWAEFERQISMKLEGGGSAIAPPEPVKTDAALSSALRSLAVAEADARKAAATVAAYKEAIAKMVGLSSSPLSQVRIDLPDGSAYVVQRGERLVVDKEALRGAVLQEKPLANYVNVSPSRRMRNIDPDARKMLEGFVSAVGGAVSISPLSDDDGDDA